jgi:hypothetical protein
MEVLQNPVMWRAIERLLMVAGGIVLGILGYRLFIFGMTKGRNDFSAFKLAMVGTGPGLFFMGFGATVLITALLKGGVSSHSIKDDPGGPTYEAQIHQQKPKEMDAAGEDSDSMTQAKGTTPASAASEVLWKKEAVNDMENNAVVGGNFAMRIQDFTPVLLAPEGGYVVKDLGEELIRRHAVTEFEKKFHN